MTCTSMRLSSSTTVIHCFDYNTGTSNTICYTLLCHHMEIWVLVWYSLEIRLHRIRFKYKICHKYYYLCFIFNAGFKFGFKGVGIETNENDILLQCNIYIFISSLNQRVNCLVKHNSFTWSCPFSWVVE